MVDTVATTEAPQPSSVRPVAFHAIFDCSGADLAKIQNETNIKNWLADVTGKIGLTATETPIVKLSTTEGLTGYLAIQLVGGQSIDASFVDSSKQIYVDVFTGIEFNPDLIETSIKEFFGSSTVVKKILIPRNAAM
jgi:hypothetical protein